MAVISFKCPNCDGELIFDPKTQKYKCEYCGSKFTQAELDALQPAESERMVLMKQSRKQPNSRVRTQRKKKGRMAAQRQSFITALPVEQKS